ncbi:uncharacterized protein LOC100880736 isoform X2 [Megachile rotundata]|uniref:uncharacterized protein LOC100880736 isoform X2 n=1 Tax=Megachile rotundata TaxID=143995 RepID=UPI003FD67D3A
MQANSQKLENIRTTILSLLLARKGGCTLRQLDNDYCEVEGTNIPWKDFGYISLLNFLHAMSKNVHIENKNNTIILKGIASDKSKHVSKLVAGQKDQSNLTGRKVYKPSHYYPKTAPPKIRIPAEILLKIINLIHEHPDGISKDYVHQAVKSLMPFANITMQDMEDQFRELSHKIFLTNNKIFPTQNKIDYSKKTNGVTSSDFVSESYNGQGRQSPIVTVGGDEDSDIVSDYDDDDDLNFIRASNLCPNKSTVNTKPTSNFIKETVSKCQDQIIDFDNDHIEYNNNFGNRKDCTNDKNGEILINERVKFRLEKLIQNHPNGIWCADLPEVYLEEYKVSLNYMELGFNSVREFASQLPEIFHCVQLHDTGDFMLYYAKNEIPANKLKGNHKVGNLAQLHQIYETSDEEALPVTVSLDVCKELIPDDTMSIGECVGYISVTDLMQDEKPYIEVIVVEVFTPSFFWIQLRKKQRTFKKFMDELHNFYVTKHEQYTIPPLVLEKGLNCACMYNGLWHRGIIKTVKPDLQVTVMFYDYGTLKTYPPDEIHYLHRMFSYLPAQAIPCGLVNTRPYKGCKWSRSATHHFAIRTQMPLIATIASINVDDNSMLVTLTDTSEEEDVHINDWLVEQKLAEHGKMGEKVEMNNLLLYVEENLVFSPEICYETESSIPDNCSKESTKESINVPLVLPQSTLEDSYFKTAPKLSERSQNLTRTDEENTQDKISQNNTHTFTKNHTNPFLQATPAYNEGDLSPKRLMQLWTENLQLQMQITTTLSILFNKVLNNSTKSENGNLTNSENVNTSNTFLRTNDNILSTSSANTNIFNTYQETTFSNAKTCNENLNTNTYSNPFQNNGNQNTVNDCTKQATKTVRVPPGYEKYHNRFKFDENYFLSNTINNLTTFDNYSNSNVTLRETNPFKLSLAGKLNISDPQEDNHSNSVHLPSNSHENQNLISNNDSISQRFDGRDNFKMKTSTEAISEKGTLYNHPQCCFNNTSNNTSNIKTESFVSNTNTLPSQYHWNIDNVNNGMSRMTINDQNMQHPDQKVNEIKKYIQEHVAKDKKDFNIESQTDVQKSEKSISNYDMNGCKFSTKMPTNNLDYNSTLINNTNFQEGYFSHATTQNLYTSSPLLQTNNKTECSQQLLSENANKVADTLVKAFENTAELNNWNKVPFLPQTSDQTMTYPKNQSHQRTQNLDKEEVAVSPINENQLRDIVRDVSSDDLIFFQVFELPNTIIHIFHHQGEGWLLTDEFIQGFTKFESTSYAMILLYTLNIPVQYKNINIIHYPSKFINIGSTVSKTMRDMIHNKNNIHLIQLKSVIEILNKLEIISERYEDHALMNDSVIQDMWFSLQLINNAYKNLKYRVESTE